MASEILDMILGVQGGGDFLTQLINRSRTRKAQEASAIEGGFGGASSGYQVPGATPEQQSQYESLRNNQIQEFLQSLSEGRPYRGALPMSGSQDYSSGGGVVTPSATAPPTSDYSFEDLFNSNYQSAPSDYLQPEYSAPSSRGTVVGGGGVSLGGSSGQTSRNVSSGNGLTMDGLTNWSLGPERASSEPVTSTGDDHYYDANGAMVTSDGSPIYR